MIYLMIFLFVVVSFLIFGYQQVPANEEWIVERLGARNKKLSGGPNFIIPFIDKIRDKHDMRVQELKLKIKEKKVKDTVDGSVKTEKKLIELKGGGSAEVEASLLLRVVDPFKATYATENYEEIALSKLEASIRSTLGERSVDDAATVKETKLGKEIEEEIGSEFEEWGIELMPDGVIIRNIGFLPDIIADRNKVYTAEKEGEALIIRKKAEKKASELEGEGEASKLRAIQEGVVKSDKAADYNLKSKTIEALKDAKIVSVGGDKKLSLPAEIGTVFGATAEAGKGGKDDE